MSALGLSGPNLVKYIQVNFFIMETSQLKYYLFSHVS